MEVHCASGADDAARSRYRRAQPHPVQVRAIKRVLEARERRRRGQVLAINRVAITEQLLDRVGSQSARIIGIRIAAGDRNRRWRTRSSIAWRILPH